MDLYTIRGTIESPIVWILRSVCSYGKFVFILVLSLRTVRQKWRRVMLRATDSQKKVLLHWDNFQLAQFFHILWLKSCSSAPLYLETLFPCRFLRLSVFLSDALNYFLPIPSHSMWKDRAIWKLSKRESTFSVNHSRVTWRVLIFDEQIYKMKLK